MRLTVLPTFVALIVAAPSPGLLAASSEHMARIGAGEFESVAPPSETVQLASLEPYLLDITPVTNREFLDFVVSHPEWRRDRVSSLFADERYLGHWPGPAELGPGAGPDQPVTMVSWFAATAYCESLGKRLPTWYEWEYASAASEDRPDARDDPLWRQEILRWYSTPGSEELSTVGSHHANYYGVHDLNGLIWEWVQDFNALLVSGDNREQGGADKLQFCGAGALTMEQKEHYAVLMRVAMLSSMEANYTTRNVGFRCASGTTGDGS